MASGDRNGEFDSLLPDWVHCHRQHSFHYAKPPRYRYGGAVFKENIMGFKEREKILEYLAQRENEKFCHILAEKLSNAGVDFEEHDEKVRENLIKELIEKAPKV